MNSNNVCVRYEVSLRNEHRVVHNTSRNTYNMYNYIKCDLYINDTKVRLNVNSLLNVLKSSGLYDSFIKDVEEILIVIQEKVKSVLQGKTIKMPFSDYPLKDVEIDFYTDTGFYVSIYGEGGRENILKYWNAYLKELNY